MSFVVSIFGSHLLIGDILLNKVDQTQVMAYCRWIRWIHQRVIAGDSNFVIVNMDETAIQNEYDSRKGYVVPMRLTSKTQPEFYSRVSTTATRAQLTLAAFICNDASLQKHLPQVLLPKTRLTTIAEWALYDALQEPVITFHNTTGWVDSGIMKRLLTLLRRKIKQQRPDAKIILLFDGAPQHLSADVIKHANCLELILLMVPTQLTWMLQPLDVFVFKELKSAVIRNQLHVRMQDPGGLLTKEARVHSLGHAVQSILVDKDWSHTFAAVGLSDDVGKVKDLSLIHIPSPRDRQKSRMPSSA